MKYNLERHPDFKVDQSNIKVDVLEGYMNSVRSWWDFSGRVLYVCMFVCFFVFFWLRIREKIEIPLRLCRSRKSLMVSPIASCGGYAVAPFVNGRCHL